MPISEKSWAVVDGTATAFALAPLAIPSVLDQPVGSRGVVVAAVPGPAVDPDPAAGTGTADAGEDPTVSPASPSTPRARSPTPHPPRSRRPPR